MSPQSASGLHCNYITAEFEHKNRILGTCNRTVLSVTVQEQIVKKVCNANYKRSDFVL